MAEQLLSCEHPTSRNPSSKKQGNKPARTAAKDPCDSCDTSGSQFLTHYGDFASASSCPSPAGDFSNSPPAFASRRTLATGCFCRRL
jgi:hypothetical protein